VAFQDGDRSPRFRNAPELAERADRVLEADEALGAPDEIKRTALERQFVGVAVDEIEPRFVGAAMKLSPCDVEIGAGEIAESECVGRAQPTGEKLAVEAVAAGGVEDAAVFRDGEIADRAAKLGSERQMRGPQQAVIGRELVLILHPRNPAES